MDFLAEIVARKMVEARKLYESGAIAAFRETIARRPPPLSLKEALDRADPPAIIAEIKRASPSKGKLGRQWNPVELARSYQEGGAAAISVLTEIEFFHGDPDFIPQMRPLLHLPILRKDFILEPIQVYETAALGADALLLIVRLLEPDTLAALLLLARSLGLEALVEVHTRTEMATAVAAGARVIGINSRDLQTFQMHPDRALELAPLAPPGVTLVAASGLKSRADLECLEAVGIRAFLIGESLVTEADPGRKLQEFRGRQSATGS
jgi:indole-3-glycerol phosphate synthase